MSQTDIRADLLDCILTDVATDLTAKESADSDNVILVTDADGNRYKLTIEKL